MDRETALKKIQKALNLANNSAATPGEAASALRQAQALMRNFGIDEKTLQTVGYARERVQMPVQAGKKVPLYITELLAFIRDAFGVKSVIEREQRVSDRSWTVNYFGPDHRVVMAGYTHTVIWRAMDKGWFKFIKENPQLKGDRGARSGYYMGWLETVREQIQKMGEEEEKAADPQGKSSGRDLVVLPMTDDEKTGTELILRQYFPDTVKSQVSKISLDTRAISGGIRDAQGFQLHRPVSGTVQGKLS